MKQTINFFQFREAFRQFNRMDNFPGDGLSVLFNWLEEYEDSTGEEIELDVIALCCDFCQMSWQDIGQDYQIDPEDREAILEYLQDQTLVVGLCNDGAEVIFQQF